MGVSFVEPRYLWLLLLALPIIWLGLIGGRRVTRWRQILSVGLRVLILLALVGALAGTQLVRPVRELTTIFLIDTSDSITPNQRAQQEQFIAEALRTMPDGDRAALVVFGENALIERVPSTDRTLGRIQSVPIVARTNIEEALTLALALFPADTQKRLVLLSDGGENQGRALQSVRLAVVRDVPIDIVPIVQSAGAEVAITSLRVPTQARVGQELQLIATVDSSTAQSAQLRFLVDGVVLNERTIDVPAGSSEYNATLTLNDQGYHKLTAQIIPSDDIRRQNNEATALVNISGPPRVLVVANTPADGTNISAALEAAQLTPTVVPPSGLPTTLAGLADYEAIIIANVPSRLIPDDTQRALQSYVRDLGYGLLMIGGENSYGIGGYANTPIAETLPVDMELRNRDKYPAVSVAVVFDISGSMSEQVGGRMKVELAADGAARVAQLLRSFDEITVIPFDSAPQNPIGPVSGEDRDAVSEEIIARGVPGGGGINVHDGLAAAGTVMTERNAPIRHIIIMADGSDSQQQEGSIELAQTYLEQGITTSVVAIGNGGDVPFLENLAAAGGGRFFLVEDALSLPDILLQEAQLSFAPYLVEKDFTPLLGGDSPILAGLIDQGWPTLHGYNGTMPKDSARVVLYGLDDAPLLAQWQYGLGRSVAWTSDMKGKWGRELVAWPQFPRLAAQMIGWMLPIVSSDNISINSSFVGTELEITVDGRDANGQPLSGLVVSTNVVNDDGVQTSVQLAEIGAGVYQGRVPSPQAGTYFLQVGGATADGKPVFQRQAGVIVPYSPEYRQGQANPLLLDALAQNSGGRILDDPAAAFEHTLRAVTRATPIGFGLLLLGLLVLPLDVAVRRIRIGRLDALAQRVRGRRAARRAAAAPTPAMQGLAAAKDRARERYAEPAPINTEAAPVYRAAPPPPPRAAPQPEAPPAPSAPSAPAPAPSLGPAPKSVNLDEITDPLERLRAAKNRARRR